MKFLDQIFKKMREAKDTSLDDARAANPKACFNCGTTENVKYKGGQMICKKCLRQARKMAKRYTRGG